MINLDIIHYTYIVVVIIIIVLIALKKDIILTCILGLGIIGYVFTGDLLKAIQIIYKGIAISGKEFVEIIVVIAMVNGMSKALHSIGSDELIIKPVKKLMINNTMAFFVLGITMTLTSWFIWPTPAVIFIGSIMVPAAISAGLPAIWAAVVLTIFGNGVALSSDFIIQAAPSITAKTAMVQNPTSIIKASIPYWSVMSIITISVAYFLMKKEVMSYEKVDSEIKESKPRESISIGARIVAIVTPLIFLTNIILIIIFKLQGSDATALIGGTATLIMIISVILNYNLELALGEITKYIKDGFAFGISIFAPIIIIGAFFFLGNERTAVEILGEGAPGIFNDIGIYVTSKIPLSKFSVIGIQTVVSLLLGVSGSGFAGLPLVGTLAHTFSSSININRESIAALGQIITVWIGGGTIIPWSVVAAAGICNVEPFEVARKNIIPVTTGVLLTVLVALIFL